MFRHIMKSGTQTATLIISNYLLPKMAIAFS